jgi:hypothetical protein
MVPVLFIQYWGAMMGNRDETYLLGRSLSRAETVLGFPCFLPGFLPPSGSVGIFDRYAGNADTLSSRPPERWEARSAKIRGEFVEILRKFLRL